MDGRMDDFGLWMKTRYLLKNLDEDTLRERQNDLLDVLGGLRRILSIFVDSLPRSTLLSLCNLLYPPQPSLDMNIMNTFQSLPDEMINLICNYLNVIDLKNLQQTCCQFAIISRSDLSIKPALKELNDDNNNLELECSIGFKQQILSLIQTDNINTKFLHLSSLISSNINKPDLLIKHGIISKLVEFIKYDNKKCNFKYKYEAMKILIDLLDNKESENNKQYLEEMSFGYDVLSSFHNLCKSESVSKLLHYTSCNDHYDAEIDNLLSLNKNDRLIMETDGDIIRAFRWDCNARRWRECGDGRGRICVYQNVQSGMHKFMFFHNDILKLLQYIDNQQGVTWNRNDCSIYWRGDDYQMHTNGTWKFKFDFEAKKPLKTHYIQQAIQLYDCFNTYSQRDNQTVGAKIITQLDSNNIFDHFYWLTASIQQYILNILQSDVPSLNENGIKLLYHQILYIKRNNRNDEIQHIIGCGVINKIIRFITPYSNNLKLVSYSIKILISLIDINCDKIVNEYKLIDIFYDLLSNMNIKEMDDDCDYDEILQDIIECIGSLTKTAEWRHESIKIGILSYIFINVLDFNAIIQSISVVTIYNFFNNFTNLDFATIDNKLITLIPKQLIKLLEKADFYDDIEMKQQLLLTIESFCDGTNSECRSRIILSSQCLKYVAFLLNESILNESPKKNNFQIESSCIRIIGNVLCDCIWSDFEDKTVQCLDQSKYLQTIHKLFNNTKLCRDILWSLSNILISNKGISWIITYEPIINDIVLTATTNNDDNNNHKLQTDAAWSLCNAFRHSTSTQKLIFLKCGFIDVVLTLIGINQFKEKKKIQQNIRFYMEKIVKATIVNPQNKQNKIYESQLKYILQQKSDQTFIKNLKKILDILQSGYIA